MRKIKKLQEKGFYILEAINSANTHLIENQRELDQFFIFADAHLRNYMTIHDYCVTPVGWNLLVHIKDKSTILRMHERAQKRRDKPFVWQEVWRILSEQIRVLRSRMTNWTNKKRKREGNASKNTYRRYVFSSLNEGIEYIQKVRNQAVCFFQPTAKYNPLEENYDTDKKIEGNQEQLSSKSAQEGTAKKRIYLKSLKISNYVSEQLEKWIKKTCAMHEMAYEGDMMRE